MDADAAGKAGVGAAVGGIAFGGGGGGGGGFRSKFCASIMSPKSGLSLIFHHLVLNISFRDYIYIKSFELIIKYFI